MSSSKLYYKDPTLTSWNTVIVDAKKSENLWAVTLKETAFYPEGGGQPSDKGTIGGIEVLDVIKENDEINHIIKELPDGNEVFCELDFSRRVDFTQHHTGQHLLSATILQLYKIETVSFHLSEETATIDLKTNTLTDNQLDDIEKNVNHYIFQNRQVNIFTVNVEDAAQYSLRKVPPGHATLRIVEIEGIEYNACGGTHVGRTAEISMMKLLKTEKNKDLTRLYFICGNRLLKDYKEKLSLVKNLTNQLSTSPQLLSSQVNKIIQDSKQTSRKLTVIFSEYAELLAQKLIQNNNSELLYESYENLTIKELTVLSSKVVERSGMITFFASQEENKILIAHNGNLDIHCGKIIKENVGRFNGKGGGDHKKAQAVFPNREDLNRFVKEIQSVIRNTLE